MLHIIDVWEMTVSGAKYPLSNTFCAVVTLENAFYS